MLCVSDTPTPSKSARQSARVAPDSQSIVGAAPQKVICTAERNLKCRYAKKTEQLVHALLREMGMQCTPTPCNDCGTCHREFFHLPPEFDGDCIDDLLVFAKSVVEYLY
ncbi:hypothetical protein K435DRAFT_793157 [Dendrothele bispora CBS 962.96]|uniref:Bacteriophage T5 Orf172 DNA-binding domain-containing protein n=1 Tax=Dendrothele bispora (strain CBS 962.96) TaxID=1314807 RepID=A0A4S8MGA5_DENBC|nr:hypothetical protein K435DRAFT_793157 [Dendrothele bispora CBS 962.96]